jgi:hypothetical protein
MVDIRRNVTSLRDSTKCLARMAALVSTIASDKLKLLA